ncbi:MAG: SIMPL domain-containing protein [Natronomonas sp.]
MNRERTIAFAVLAGAVLALLLVAAAVAIPGSADEPATEGASIESSQTNGQITVSADGTASAEPDTAVVSVDVTADGDEVAAVRDDIADDADALRSALDEIDAEYETVGYRIDEPRVPPREQRDGPAYRGVHSFEVTVDVAEAGAVIDRAIDAGAEVDGVEYTLTADRREDLRQEAIDDAMADAQMQADAVSTAGDVALDGVERVDATQRRGSSVRLDAPVPAAEADAAPDTTIETGDVTVSYSVTVVYATD